MLGIPIALIASDAAEWAFHKYVQHGIGRHRDSFFGFHWQEHHPVVRRQGFHDPVYTRSIFGNNAHAREFWPLVGLNSAILPLTPVAPFFVGTATWRIWKYYRTHKRAHMDPEWGRNHVPWHYDHHMGPNPHANYCVTNSWFDHLMGTRQRWAGTEREATLRKRRGLAPLPAPRAAA